VHEDDTLSRFERSEPFTGRIEPLDGYVLVEPVDDETETNAGLIIPASAESACIAGIVVAAGDDASGIAPGDKVLYPRGAGFEIRIGGQPKRLLDRQELIARLYDERAAGTRDGCCGAAGCRMTGRSASTPWLRVLVQVGDLVVDLL
jgi:co-chaperonin GroES (HSP10)